MCKGIEVVVRIVGLFGEQRGFFGMVNVRNVSWRVAKDETAKGNKVQNMQDLIALYNKLYFIL